MRISFARRPLRRNEARLREKTPTAVTYGRFERLQGYADAWIEQDTRRYSAADV